MSLNQIKQSVLIKANSNSIMPQVVLWGEAEWWPKKSLMKIERISSFSGQNSRYLQRVRLPYGPRWHTKTEIISDGYVKRVFLNGMFSPGFEEISLKPDKEGTRLEYNFCFSSIKGKVSRILWKLFFRRLHVKNVDAALLALRNYVEGKK